MNTHNQSCIPVELRIALYRRAVACAYQTTCEQYGIQLALSLDALEAKIANEVEAFHVEEYGLEMGVEVACAMLGDMVTPDILDTPPRLTTFGEWVMDDVCRHHLKPAGIKATVH
ncbi:DUF5375 family protein [Acerihabitans sp. TG2]|uniref:DUF5375 family protein n=1 Tax=Acerihabitans sp. TG2 TaxID=3096008 RepID=UPI002B22A20D|nr:DUF5375 family protein [Acerihabitans sp. TG2]MEA9393401.1 DUF5375 family protein [Acerihabitans sp. TG2]